jgi:hypothetical protein
MKHSFFAFHNKCAYPKILFVFSEFETLLSLVSMTEKDTYFLQRLSLIYFVDFNL